MFLFGPSILSHPFNPQAKVCKQCGKVGHFQRDCPSSMMASIKLVNNEPNEIQGRAHRRCAVGYLTRAIILLRALLAQPFDARRRGKWYDRLYVDLGHLKEYQKQFDVCKAALEAVSYTHLTLPTILRV